MTGWRLRFEPAITPLFRTWWRMRRPMTLGVRGVACDESGAVLLVRHTYARGWHLPGGGVENGETAVDAVARELAEEAGVEVIGAPRLVGFYANHANFPNDHIAVYRIEQWRSCPVCENHEIAERGFFPLSALPETITRGTRRRLAELFEGAPLSADW
jgi:ADP-ribose pyrophosphatase YjhB (NUDIX family)